MQNRNLKLLIFGLAVGALSAFVIARLSGRRLMPDLDAWRQALAEKRDEFEAALMVARAQGRYMLD